MGRPLSAKSLTFWQSLDAFSPVVVRLAARQRLTGGHVFALSSQEIAIIAGLPLTRVQEIAQSFSWDDVTISEAKRFCDACGFDPTNALHRKRQAAYAHICQQTRPNKPPHYLKSSPWWETEFLPLIQSLCRYRNSSEKPSEDSPLSASRTRQFSPTHS